jgi:hypothetical protein
VLFLGHYWDRADRAVCFELVAVRKSRVVVAAEIGYDAWVGTVGLGQIGSSALVIAETSVRTAFEASMAIQGPYFGIEGSTVDVADTFGFGD